MRIDEAHRARQQALREHVGGRLGVLLGGLPSFETSAVVAYVNAAYPTVAGGQQAAAATSAGYAEIRARASRRRARRPIDVASALTRSGVLVTPKSPSLVSPVLRAMGVAAGGSTFVEALAAAASYAYALSSTDLQAAANVGLDEGADASGARIAGYAKELAPDACEWCQGFDGEVFETAGDVPFHERDACSVAPVFE